MRRSSSSPGTRVLPILQLGAETRAMLWGPAGVNPRRAGVEAAQGPVCSFCSPVQLWSSPLPGERPREIRPGLAPCELRGLCAPGWAGADTQVDPWCSPGPEVWSLSPCPLLAPAAHHLARRVGGRPERSTCFCQRPFSWTLVLPCPYSRASETSGSEGHLLVLGPDTGIPSPVLVWTQRPEWPSAPGLSFILVSYGDPCGLLFLTALPENPSLATISQTPWPWSSKTELALIDR